MQKALGTTPELIDDIQLYIDQTQPEIERVEQAMEKLGVRPGRKICETIHGLERRSMRSGSEKGPIMDLSSSPARAARGNMSLGVPVTLEPMEARPTSALPEGPGWLLEPKYDGFRCLIFRDDGAIDVRSRRQRPLGRYFPEIVEASCALPIARFVLDGELVIPGQPFDALQHRLHPAASRVRKLAHEHPARFIAFDLLADHQGRSLLGSPFSERRKALEQFMSEVDRSDRFRVSEATTSAVTARKWLGQLGHGLDGIVAKRLDIAYQPGQRAMQKFKLWHTVDCVVGGLYYKSGTRSVEYLLMGLYDDAGRLNYVGRCGVGEDGDEIGRLLAPLVAVAASTAIYPAAKVVGRGGNGNRFLWSRAWWPK